ncbi:MAG: sugar phosphate isomerase/epimerase, partial [Bryobacterales bacterium]|nr:sugar phosphate isomerase/epimerase [Bryobacterales bacterium]
MRLGFHTILWGRRIGNLDHVLDVIKSAGFEGIEFAQPPSRLGLRGNTPEAMAADLAHRLHDRRLELLGLVAGSLEERFDFAKAYQQERARLERRDVLLPYLYSDETDFACLIPFLNKGARIAVHTMHPGKLARWQDAKEFLGKDPRLLWLPDTAHLTISGSKGTLKEALTTLPVNRLAGVHLKDWVSTYGTFSHRYARGFVELGEGEVELDAAIQHLTEASFDGWLITELDHTRTTPEKSTVKCAQWLRSKKLLAVDPDPVAQLEQERIVLTVVQLRILHRLQEAWLPDAVSGVPAFHDRAAAELVKTLAQEGVPCQDVGVWEYNPARDILDDSFSVVGLASAELRPPDFELTYDEFKCALAISRAAMRTEEESWHQRTDNALFRKYGAEVNGIKAVPLYDQFSPHQLRFV